MDLTFFIGRPFVDVITPDNGTADWFWAIRLESGGVIKNKDESLAIPLQDDLNGTVFIRPIFSELDTRLQFGTGDAVQTEIVLTPTKYTVSDPIYGEGEEYPQVPVEILDTVPPDPSDERVVQGPEQTSTEEEES